MYQVDGLLKGLVPILFNAYTTKARSGKLRHEELLEEATRRVYRDPETQVLVWPGWNLQRCMEDGARLGEVKLGRKSIGQYLRALVAVEGDPSFGRVDYDGLHTCMGRIPPRTGAMVELFRPKLDPGWTLSFRLLVHNTSIDPDTLKQVLQFGGLLAGMGSWRPRYGRFAVERFEVAGSVQPDAVAPKASRKKAVA